MFERLVGKLLQSFLSKHATSFDEENVGMGVWSGFVSLSNLHLSPVEIPGLLLHQIHLSKVQITIPWNSGDKDLVVLIDGVHVLASTSNEMPTDTERKSSKQTLSQPKEKWWKRWKHGVIQQLVKRIQIHVRNVHVRIENDEHKFAAGLVCESLHLGNNTDNSLSTKQGGKQKIIQIYHWGLYLNAVDGPRQGLPMENTLLVQLPMPEATNVLAETIARRSSLLASPKHSYLLVPLDAKILVQFQTSPQQLSMEVNVSEATWTVRDYQCLKLLIWHHEFKELRYRAEHFGRYRPRESVAQNPRAWWRYACKAVRYELREHRLRWSWTRFRRRFEQCQAYSQLYERKLLNLDYDNDELERMESELDEANVILFQAVLVKRHGRTMPQSPSWWNRAVNNAISSDEKAEQEYNRLLQYLDDLAENDEVVDNEAWRVSCHMDVEQGRIALFSPLQSTNDLTELLRLQEEFLVLKFVGSKMKGEIDSSSSLSLWMDLEDYSVVETRSDGSKHDVVARHYKNTNSGSLLLLEVGEDTSSREKGPCKRLHGTMQKLHVTLSPECEWVSRVRLLLRPFPQLEEASKFWSELNMAAINSWASERLAYAAKVAIAENENLDLSIRVDCPLVSVHTSNGHSLVWDLGTAVVRTEKLSGIVDARLAEHEPSARNLSIVGFKGRPLDDFPKEEASFRTPPPPPPQQSNGNFSSPARSMAFEGFPRANESSVRIDGASVLDADGFDLVSVLSRSKKSMDSIFYDFYEVRVCSGTLELQCPEEKENKQLLDELGIRVSIHKSIIPADHSLCRLKMFVSVEKIMVSLSESILESLGNFVTTWKSTINRDLGLSYRETHHFIANRTLLNTNYGNVESEGELDCVDSDDDSEFFDALGSASVPIDDASAMFSDSWVSDTQSVIDLETRSITRTRRKRRRRSASDLSSLSDASLGKKRVNGQDHEVYLNAENLAKLEEADESKSDIDDDDEDSFHSAVSLSQAIEVSKEIEQSIIRMEGKESGLRDQLLALSSKSNFRRESLGEAVTRKQQRREVQIDLDRVVAELKALRAVLDELQAQVQRTCSEGDETPKRTNDIASSEMNKSVKVANALMLTNVGENQTRNGHVLVEKGDQDHFQLWFMISVFEVQFHSKEGEKENSLSVVAERIATAWRQSISLSRILFSVEKCTAMHCRRESVNPTRQLLLSGGANNLYRAQLLPSVLPQFFPSGLMDEYLLQGTIEIGRPLHRSVADSSSELRKVKVAFGDLDATFRKDSLKFLEKLLSRFRLSPESGQQRSVNGLSKKSVTYYDVTIRTSSFRLLALNEENIGAAAALGGLSLRVARSATGRKMTERTQAQLRCENFQLLSISDYNLGQGMEILTKQDLYNPLVDVTFRSQLVPRKIIGGWVVEVPPSMDLDVEDELFTNVHVGVKIDCLESHLSSDNMHPIMSALSIAPSSFAVKREDYQETTREQSSNFIPHRTRWRVDLSLGKSLAMIRRPNSASESATILATARMRLMLRSRCDHPSGKSKGPEMKCRLEDISISLVSVEAAILAPLTLRICANLNSRESLVQPDSLKNKSLAFPPQHYWSLEDFDEVEMLSKPRGESGSCSLLFSPVVVTAWPAAIKLLADLSVDLTRWQNTRQRKDSHAEGSKQTSPVFSICVKLVETELNMQEDDSIGPFQPKTMFRVVTNGAKLCSLASESKLNVSLDFASLGIQDLSSRPGIVVLDCQSPGTSEVFLHINCEADLSGTDGPSCRLTIGTGPIRFLVLPRFMRSAISFVDSMKGLKWGGDEESKSEPKRTMREHEADLTFNCELVEIMLLSEDIRRKSREEDKTKVDAVVIRMRLRLLASTSMSKVEKIEMPFIPDEFSDDDKSAISGIIEGFLAQNRQAEKFFRLSISPSFYDIQMLRTTAKRSSWQSHNLAEIYVFKGLANRATEQRITNAFNLVAKMRRVGVLSYDNAHEFASAYDIEFGMVDALLYIRQSAGGTSDAIRASVLPCIDIMKERDSTAHPTQSNDHTFIRYIVGGPTVIAVRGDGIQITCVPGGATRLTESPIVKLVLKGFKSGAGVAHSECAIKPEERSRTRPQRLSHDCYECGAWVTFEASAYYHNRRLVVWEPFLEPWSPTVDFYASLRSTSEEASNQELGTTPRRPGLRAFGRLLRSPFQGEDTAPEPQGVQAMLAKECNGAELGYVFVMLMAPETVLSALARPDVALLRQTAVSIRSSLSPQNWVRFFLTDHVGRALKTQGFSLSLVDNRPLNVNLTGSMLEVMFEYIVKGQEENPGPTIPHWIRNDTGLTIRFHEVLDLERSFRGESSSLVTLMNGSELPLSLERSISQSCDPHKGFISVELGTFKDTIGRVAHGNFLDSVSPEERYFFKASTKVPVDTVGLFRVALDWNLQPISQTMAASDVPGYLLVRVALRGCSKLVSLESPLLLRNNSMTPLVCEARHGEALLWKCVVPNSQWSTNEVVPVPLDLVPNAHHPYCTFGIDQSSSVNSKDCSEKVNVPKPFSKRSLQTGVIEEANVKLSNSLSTRCINVCGIRVGSFSFGQSKESQDTQFPEQRLLLFRSQAVFWNHLAFPIAIQAKVGTSSWLDLGFLRVGGSVGWDGADPTQEITLRIKFLESKEFSHADFPNWSQVVSFNSQILKSQVESKVEMYDKNENLLSIHLRIEPGDRKYNGSLHPNESNALNLSNRLESGSKAFHIYAPYWIVDNTGLNLEYKTSSFVAGQTLGWSDSPQVEDGGASYGLNELLRDTASAYLGMKPSFRVLMLGDTSGKIWIRCSSNAPPGLSSWSEPISLATRHDRRKDIYVHKGSMPTKPPSEVPDATSLLALRARIVRASEPFGGNLGTKIVHIYCRYSVRNELGRDIELRTFGVGSRKSAIVAGDSRERDFHLLESKSISFRPTEFGWDWSGRFHIPRESRKELIFALRHKMREEKLHVSVEFVSRNDGGTQTMILRAAVLLPYRIENKCMYPLQFRQTRSMLFSLLGDRGTAQSEVILPFHSASFAWEQPEAKVKTVSLRVVDFSVESDVDRSRRLGSFALDEIIPGTRRKLSGDLEAHIVSDGPTRVLRIQESSKARKEKEDSLVLGTNSDVVKMGHQHFSYSFLIRLTTGVGVSVVDWSPQELFYLRLEDIVLQHTFDGTDELSELVIGSMLVDNCLWVTPYPVAARVGPRTRRRRKRRVSAFSIKCSRSLAKEAEFENLTLFENIEVTSEPSLVSIDGNLAERVLGMVQQTKALASSKSDRDGTSVSRNEELRIILDSEDTQVERVRLSKEALLQDDLYSAVDTVATTAIASKLRFRYRPLSKGPTASPKRDEKPLQRKFYIERLRISNTAAQLSWSGALPLTESLPRWMRPSLTFEGFPFFLRPYSSSHAYGTAEEHLEDLQSHYLSFWRLFDLLLGTARPLFIIRACYFTTREVVSSISAGLSSWLESGANHLASVSRPVASDNRITGASRNVIAPLSKGGAASLMFFSTGFAACSALLRYDAAYHIATGGLVRTRNPRLFAHVDGKDMLVEYVEGENAGKALLSRVRMGVHLGEGYVHHFEDVKTLENGGESILMITFDRLMLLNGELNIQFCAVLWEILVADLVRISIECNEEFLRIHFWFLSGSGQKSPEERGAYALIGLDSLSCHTVALSPGRVDDFIEQVAPLVPRHILDR